MNPSQLFSRTLYSMSILYNEHMLEVQNLHKTFGALKALNNVSFSVAPGELFGFVGSNGAGKTTAMRIMLGVLSADSGQTLWKNKVIDADLRRRIGYMPAERGLYPKMPVGEQLVYFARLHGLTKEEATQATLQWCERLGIAHRMSDEVQKLSLGNQQRVQLAAALVHDPDILVLDEPFSGLDPVAVDVMSQVLREKASSGTPVVFSSHQLDLVERMCDRVGIISEGVMVASGTIDELRATPTLTYALAVRADAAILSSAVSEAGFNSTPDPLEGTAQAPRIDGLSRIIVECDQNADEQALLRAALAVGPVREFTPRRAHLADLFKNVVSSSSHTPEIEEKKVKRGLFGRRKEDLR